MEKVEKHQVRRYRNRDDKNWMQRVETKGKNSARWKGVVDLVKNCKSSTSYSSVT